MLSLVLGRGLVVVGSLALLVGCGEEEKSDAASKSELEGTWIQSCGTDDDAAKTNKTYDKFTNVVTGGDIKGSGEFFSDSSCTTKLYSIRATGKFASGEAVSTPAGAKTFDVSSPAFFITLNDADYVKAFNGELADSTVICGGGFIKDKEQPLTNALCKDTEGFKTIEDSSYGIYKLDGTSYYQGDTGEPGSATDGTTPSKRPTALEKRAYTKG